MRNKLINWIDRNPHLAVFVLGLILTIEIIFFKFF